MLTADGVKEMELTSPKAAPEKAGATVDIVSPKPNKVGGWKDGQWSIEVVVDTGLVTSRSPKDLEAFNKKVIEARSEGIHERHQNAG